MVRIPTKAKAWACMEDIVCFTSQGTRLLELDSGHMHVYAADVLCSKQRAFSQAVSNGAHQKWARAIGMQAHHSDELVSTPCAEGVGFGHT